MNSKQNTHETTSADKGRAVARQGADHASRTTTMQGHRPLNSCHRCGATAYKTLIARDDSGAMRPSGQYQCVQCKLVFSHVQEWRDGLPPTAGSEASDAIVSHVHGVN